ncbi:uncharacterized protein BDW70DRAFT_151735 [Aspergillus foveolatus]|uniref:uncharacterized protein n=1 Tax=Aspergillus foveolatus TaxID=210207 RepID=UPI003CCCF092
MTGPCQFFYLEDSQAKDPHKASDENHIYDISGPPIEASSVASSLTLLFYAQNSDEELAPRPLRPRKSVQPSLPNVEPPGYTQLVTKPLPPTPSLSRNSGMQRTTSPPVAGATTPVPSRHCQEWIWPFLSLRGLTMWWPQTKPLMDLGVHLSQRIILLSAFSVSMSRSLLQVVRLMNLRQNPLGKLLARHRRRQQKLSPLKQDHISVLTRAFQRLWPAKLIRHRNPAVRSTSASAHRPLTPFVRVEPHPQRQPRPAGAAPSTPITRMGRVLSVLIDERMSLYLNNLVAAAADEPSVDHSSLRHPIRSLYKLNGVPLTPGDATPTSHTGISIFHRIMQVANDLADLFSLALINKASYLAFKSDELGNQAFAANLYRRHYAWDLMHLPNVKFLLQGHCEPLLNKDMVVGLRDPYDPRAERVDAAIWRDRNPVSGLSRQQLLDMVDFWVAMGQLMDCLPKQIRLARQHGVFDSAETPPNTTKEELHMLRAWLDFILTLGPAAVLELAPAGPNLDPARLFSRAKANEWTQWSPPPLKAPRSNFLVGIVRSMLRTIPDNDSDGNAI